MNVNKKQIGDNVSVFPHSSKDSHDENPSFEQDSFVDDTTLNREEVGNRPQNHRLSWWQRFFARCGGVGNIELLESCKPEVVSKRITEGRTALIPVLFAFVGGIFFIYTLFSKENKIGLYIALAGGFIWSMVIFNIEVAALKSIKKEHERLWDRLLSPNVLLRILIGGLLGYCVSIPLALAIFYTDLSEDLYKQHGDGITKIENKYLPLIKTLNDEIEQVRKNVVTETERLSTPTVSEEISTLRQSIADKQNEIKTANDELADETAGHSDRTKKAGRGEVAIAIEHKIADLKTDLALLKQQLASAEKKQSDALALNQQAWKNDHKQIEVLRNTANARINKKLDKINELNEKEKKEIEDAKDHQSYSFLSLSNTLDKLAQANPNVLFWERMLTCVFFALDMIALMFKVSSSTDEYDYKLQTNDYIARVDRDNARKSYEETSQLKLELAKKLLEDEAEKDFTKKWVKHEAELVVYKIDEVFNEAISKLFSSNRKINDLFRKHSGSADKHLVDEILKGFSETLSAAFKKITDIVNSKL